MHRVLVIEDDEELLETLTDILENRGYKVSSAKDGVHGLELIAHTNPDVVLLDIGLPQRDGRQILEYMQRHPKTCSVPVVIYTSTEERIESPLITAVIKKSDTSAVRLLHQLDLAVRHQLNG